MKPTEIVEVDTQARRELFRGIAVPIVVGVAVWVFIWYLEPHPRKRQVVQLHQGLEQIVTVDGVTDDGWLTECASGNRRHIVGDYTVVDDAVPVVCVTEPHYQDWVKQQAAQR